MTVLAVLYSALSSGGWIALPAALVGGVVAGLNPCCVSIYPAAVATCCAAREPQGRSLPSALALVVGLASAMAILGIAAAWLGRLMTGLGGSLQYGLALVPLVAGMHVLGWLRMPSPLAPSARLRTGGAFVAGLLLSLVVAPCGTPLLASILSYSAYRGSLPYAGVLLFLYGLGSALPVVLLGVGAANLATRLDRSGLRRWVDRVVGAMLIGTGLYLLWTA